MSAGAGFAAPSVSLPKGGGAIRGIGETFTNSPVTGTSGLSIPLPLSPGRAGFTPSLALAYDSGAGNGPYGFGWTTAIPAITRRTDRGLPRYLDDRDADTYLLAGTEDLVPILRSDGTRQEETRDGFHVQRYRPRVEGLFARIERWTRIDDPRDTYWRSISRDNVTTLYGRSPSSRISDPDHPARIFTWLACESFDAKGNAAVFDYIAEDSRGIDLTRSSEAGRTAASRTAGRYLKRVRYGNRTSRVVEPDLAQTDWLFELVMDYGDHDDDPTLQPSRPWPVRPDPFSTYRAGFEVRSYRRCQRVLISGQRARKVTERQSGTRKQQRLYFGGFEVYREYAGDGTTVTLERETLHVGVGERTALVETRTQGTDPGPTQLIHYQLSNHLGSATLELDDAAQVISYEEYYPYGSTSYQAVRSQTETPKRYRYTGMERDEETGFAYHSARYYAPWLCRWISPDPAAKSLSLYEYCRGNPIAHTDRNGRDPAADRLASVNRLMDANRDRRLTIREVLAGFDCVSMTPSEWSEAMRSNTGARYQVDPIVDALIDMHFQNSVMAMATQIEKAAQSREQNPT